MMWLTWRQFRIQALALIIPLAALAIGLIATGPGLANLYASDGLGKCPVPGNCGHATATFLAAVRSGGEYPLVYFLSGAVLYLLPAIIGAFWGAPMIARELEAGTFRLAWNQSVTRTRWTVIKLAVAAAVAMVVAGLASVLVSWWAAPIDAAGGFPVGVTQLGRFSPQVFAVRGLVPIGFTALTFSLGVTAGVLVRKVLPAMAITLAGFAAMLYLLPAFVLPHLASPVTQTTRVTVNLAQDQMLPSGQIVIPDDSLPGAWIISNQTITASGSVFTLPDVPACQAGTQEQCDAWFATQHLRRVVSYQPASRFWQLQGEETVILLAISAALAGVTVWKIRHYHP
jgi:hypothetical protein